MFDLTLLTEFKEALVYSFDPEGIPANDYPTAQPMDVALAFQVNQYEDVYNGYLQAQKQLEWLREHGLAALTPERFIA